MYWNWNATVYFNDSVTQWVSADNVLNKPKQRSVSMKVIGANRFAPQGANPKELRDKVKEVSLFRIFTK